MRVPPMLIALAVLAGCGYKAPLYLPKPKPGAQQPATPPAPQQEEKKPGDM
jgi:predicted small lipoprotein YifL